MNILWKFQLPSSSGLGLRRYFRKRLTYWLTESVTEVFVEQPRLHRVCKLYFFFFVNFVTFNFSFKSVASGSGSNEWAPRPRVPPTPPYHHNTIPSQHHTITSPHHNITTPPQHHTTAALHPHNTKSQRHYTTRAQHDHDHKQHHTTTETHHNLASWLHLLQDCSTPQPHQYARGARSNSVAVLPANLNVLRKTKTKNVTFF